MCGIAGFIGDGDHQTLSLMLEKIQHRGPDGQGEYTKDTVFFGHRRLAIVDIASGDQPIWNEDDTICVIFNGEIYNHQELRLILEKKGHHFKTHHSDTEVLVHGYEEWGYDLFEKLNGMFVFAIWDKIKNQLTLARDRFGEKPLYWAHQNQTFVFASELSSLCEHPSISRGINTLGLQKLFAYGFMPPPFSAIKNVQKLPPASFLTFNSKTQEITQKTYWSFALQENTGSNEADLTEELASLLAQSVKRRLMSDVPFGAMLSGGIDSSLVVSLSDAPLNTFTIGFKETSFDESSYAKIVADQFGTTHHTELLDITKCLETIPDVLGNLDEPISDPSILPTFLVNRFASNSVKVLLTGDGGDELFAGYDTFKALNIARFYNTVVPKSLHKVVKYFANKVPISAGNMGFDYKLKRALSGLSHPPKYWNAGWLAPMDFYQLEKTFSGTENVYSEMDALWDEVDAINSNTLHYYTQFYMPNNLMMKADRASMLNGVETRAVFLDNDLVEFAQALPYKFKYRKGVTKYLLRKVAEQRLPQEIVDRPKKGFGIPISSWLKTMPREWFDLSFLDLNSEYILQKYDEHKAGKADNRLILWTALSVGFSLKKYVD